MRVATLVKSIAARICFSRTARKIKRPGCRYGARSSRSVLSLFHMMISLSLEPAIRGGGRFIEIDGQNARLAVGAHSYNFL